MNNSNETFDLLAQTILHWWTCMSLAFVLMSLLIVFFFTMHKGLAYRAAFLMLLVVGICYIYALVLEAPCGRPTFTDALLPVLFTTWAVVTWTRSVMLLRGFKRHRANLKELAETDMSAETDWVPYLETSLFAERIERWQKWLYAMIAGAFASGILYHNVTSIENALWAMLRSNKKIEAQSHMAQSGRDSLAKALREKDVKDSLWRQYVRSYQTQQSLATRELKDEVRKNKPVRNTPQRPLYIVAPAAPQIPQGQFKMGTDAVKPVAPVAPTFRKGQKFGTLDSSARHPSPDAQLAKMLEYY